MTMKVETFYQMTLLQEKEETDVLVGRLAIIAARYKREIGPDKTNEDKQHKWLPERDQDKRLETRSSGELSGINHL